MIQATKEHYLVLETTNERTHRLADMTHNMGAWLNDGLITKETYVHIHDILRYNLGTENFLCVVGYRDERDEKNKYAIRVIEFPEKSDGTIRSIKHDEETGVFYLLNKEEEVEEVVFDATGFENNTNTEKKENE